MHPGIIILMITLLGFVTLGVILLIKKPSLPKGKAVTIETGNYKVHTVFAGGVADNKIAELSVKAVEATIKAWGITNLKIPPFNEICVLIQKDAVMQKTAKSWGYSRLDGFVSSLQTFASRAIPLITITETLAKSPVDQGAIIIHEMIHILADDYVGGKDDHANSLLWSSAAKGLPNVQDTAKTNYQALLG